MSMRELETMDETNDKNEKKYVDSGNDDNEIETKEKIDIRGKTRTRKIEYRHNYILPYEIAMGVKYVYFSSYYE